jgi:CRISPR type III-B/RAMP module-associated protein Cmr5
MLTREQQRAAFALVRVEKRRGKEKEQKFKTQLVKLPARLHANGLGQTVAFYLASGATSPEGQICGWLEEWLRSVGLCGPQVRLIDSITQSDMAVYRRAGAEARALSGWLKRFAEAFLEGEGAAS